MIHMKQLFRTLILAALTVATFSCKDEVIEKPDNLNPVKVTIADILTGKFNEQTVMIDSVYFDHLPGTKFNGTSSNASGSKTIRNCKGDGLTVFTYATDDWSYEEVPTKMGPIYGVVTEFNGVFQLRMRSIDDVKEMTKTKCPEIFTVATITEILNGDYATGTLVKILDVEFTDPTGTWGFIDDFEDCAGNTMITYVANTADFNNKPLPQGNGPLIGVLELYNTTWELIPRSLTDGAGMINERCTGGGGGGSSYFFDDFEGGSLTANQPWVVKEVLNPGGLQSWIYGTISGNYARASNWNGSINQTADWWLISPAINLSSSTAPKLNFDMVKRYTGDNIEVKISTNYDGTSAPSTATWTDITSLFTLDSDTGSWSFVNSGNGDISAHKGTSVRIAFRYIGGTSSGSTWQIDNVKISE